MAGMTLSGVDLELVLLRLTRHAQALFAAPRALGLEAVDVACPGGEGPEDLATELLLRFVDPQDTTVKWKEAYGPPTTEGVLALLAKALKRDYLDLKKSKRYTTTIYVENVKSGDGDEKGGLTLDQLAVFLETPEGRLLKDERVRRLIEEFSEDPTAREILTLQLSPDGYNAFTNQELAEVLDTTVSDIENRKKRVKNRLLFILRRQTEGKRPHA